MALIVIPNQTVEFVPNGEADFNTKNQACTMELRTYCQPVTGEVVTRFEVQISPNTGQEFINYPFLDPILPGSTTGSLADKLINSNASFTAGGIQVGYGVKRIVLFVYPYHAEVVAIDSAIQLSLDGSPFTVFPVPYVFSSFNWVDGVNYNHNLHRFEWDGTSSGAPFIRIEYWEQLTANRYWRATIHVQTYSQGAWYLNHGGTSEPQFSGVGIHFVYFQTAGVPETFQIRGSGTTLGSIKYVSIREMSSVGIQLEDCDGTPVGALPASAITYSGLMAMVTVDWGALGLSEGCYRICVEDTGDLDEDLLLPFKTLNYEAGGPLLLPSGAQINYI